MLAGFRIQCRRFSGVFFAKAGHRILRIIYGSLILVPGDKR